MDTELSIIYRILEITNNGGDLEIIINSILNEIPNVVEDSSKVSCLLKIKNKIFTSNNTFKTEFKIIEPVEKGKEKIGELIIYFADENAFTSLKEKKNFINIISDKIYFIITNKLMQTKLQTSLIMQRELIHGIIKALMIVLEKRDPYTAGHERKVQQLTFELSKKMGLSSEQIENIEMASLLHDIGKIVIPTEILCKPNKLIDLEFEIIKLHPMAGFEILNQPEIHWDISKIVLQHHERINGSGYPLKLSDKDILLEAKIIAVADVIEAITSHRPYRSSLGLDFAIGEIRKNKGILYDEFVVDTCISLFERGFEFNNSFKF
jgi:HD-GYP domain-containing protein (c-di-GMP phosphodiesterase class II)